MSSGPTAQGFLLSPLQRRDRRREVGRQRRFEAEPLPGVRLLEAERGRVQQQARRGQGLAAAAEEVAHVDALADEGVAALGEVVRHGNASVVVY